MGRRGDHSYKELSSMIINAAYSLMEKEGYAKISTRKIAASIGYTVGTLYNIFNNMDEIFMHINSVTMDKLNADLQSALDGTPDLEYKLYALSNGYIKFSQENFNLWSLLFEYRFSENQIIPKWYSAKIGTLYELVFKALKLAMPDLPEEEVKTSVMVLWTCMHGICALSIKGKLDRAGAESAQVLTNNFLKNYFKGLAIK